MVGQTHSGLRQQNMVVKSLQVLKSYPSSLPAVVGIEATLWLWWSHDDSVMANSEGSALTGYRRPSHHLPSHHLHRQTKSEVQLLRGRATRWPESWDSQALIIWTNGILHLSTAEHFRERKWSFGLQPWPKLWDLKCITRVETATLKPKPFIMFCFFFLDKWTVSYSAFFSAFFFSIWYHGC